MQQLELVSCLKAVLLLSPLLVLASPLPVTAHGGGLDSEGCHTNRKTSDRHCHRSNASSSKPISRLISGPVKLISVGDGDTVRVMSRKGVKVTIRLACIDAPETSQGKSGLWSTQTLKTLIQGKDISLKPQVKDRYGRTVAEIYVSSRNINLQMVQEGAAYAYRQYLNQCDREAYLLAESSANKKGLGVWGADKPDQRPWEFRRSRLR